MTRSFAGWKRTAPGPPGSPENPAGEPAGGKGRERPRGREHGAGTRGWSAEKARAGSGRNPNGRGERVVGLIHRSVRAVAGVRRAAVDGDPPDLGAGASMLSRRSPRRVEDLEARTRESLRSGPGPGEERGEKS